MFIEAYLQTIKFLSMTIGTQMVILWVKNKPFKRVKTNHAYDTKEFTPTNNKI